MSAEWSAILLLSGIYSMTSIAMQLGVVCGAFSMAPVGWMCVGAYSVALATAKWHVGMPAGMGLGIALALVFGPLVMLPVGRISGLYFALVSLAFVLVIQTVFAHLDYTGGPLGIFGVPLVTDFVHVGIGLGLVAILAAWMSTGRRGRAMRAAGQDRAVARSMGIHVVRLQLIVGSVSAAIAAVAGGLYAAYVGYVDPMQYGFAMVVQVLVMVIVGGRGSWFGAILGTLLILSLPQILQPLAAWRDVVNGALLVAVAVLFPQGLIGLKPYLVGILPGGQRLAPIRKAE